MGVGTPKFSVSLRKHGWTDCGSRAKIKATTDSGRAHSGFLGIRGAIMVHWRLAKVWTMAVSFPQRALDPHTKQGKDITKKLKKRWFWGHDTWLSFMGGWAVLGEGMMQVYLEILVLLLGTIISVLGNASIHGTSSNLVCIKEYLSLTNSSL